ncbi:hypothetical protein CRE_12210 [Caenorhabditis remanei]|uniref:F-box domain-containing protein n=1 Tax=Caenorhabditis remanei TaxID=31234 RepID=E3N099_CAERE|nr:hypothetical protein CRE_12210 [Caenorhabditis remanei]
MESDEPPRALHFPRVAVKVDSRQKESINFMFGETPILIKCVNLSPSRGRLNPLVDYMMRNGEIGDLQVKVEKPNKSLGKIMETILEKSEKSDLSNWKPFFDTNWNDLTEKLKKKCIELMHFKTRLRLRKTSKTERLLVDSLKLDFDFLKIDTNARRCYEECTELSFRDSKFRQEVYLKFSEMSEFHKTAVPLLTYILKIGNIITFACEMNDIWMYEMFSEIRCQQEGNVKFRIKKYLNSTSLELKQTLFVLENCENQLKTIVIDPKEYEEEELQRFVCLSTVANAQNVNIGHVSFTATAIGLIEKWIENDVAIGTKFEFDAVRQETIDEFVTNFEERVISRNKYDDMTIRMDSLDRVICMKCGPFYYTSLTFIVIPSDPLESALLFDKNLYSSMDSDDSSYEESVEFVKYRFDESEDDDEIYHEPLAVTLLKN